MDYIITIDDSLVPRVEQGFANQNGYQSTIGLDDQGNPIPNPQSPRDFLIQTLKGFIANSVTANEVTISVGKARDLTLQGAIDLGKAQQQANPIK